MQLRGRCWAASRRLIGWGIPRERVLEYETHVKGGKFLVIVRGEPQAIARARELLDHQHADQIEVFDGVSLNGHHSTA